MEKSELEAMPLDRLWSLHEQLTAILSKRIMAEKRQLESRLVQLNRGKNRASIGCGRGKINQDGSQKPSSPLSQGFPKISESSSAVRNLVWTG